MYNRYIYISASLLLNVATMFFLVIDVKLIYHMITSESAYFFVIFAINADAIKSVSAIKCDDHARVTNNVLIAGPRAVKTPTSAAHPCKN